jgi:hypothetical protein
MGADAAASGARAHAEILLLPPRLNHIVLTAGQGHHGLGVVEQYPRDLEVVGVTGQLGISGAGTVMRSSFVMVGDVAMPADAIVPLTAIANQDGRIVLFFFP